MSIRVYEPQTVAANEAPTPRIRREFKGSVHVQLTQVNDRNRSYGAARELDISSELGAFLQALAESGVGPTVPSLAGTGAEYMAFEYLFHDDNTLRIEVQVADNQEVPTFALPYMFNGVIRAVVSGIPAEVVRQFA